MNTLAPIKVLLPPAEAKALQKYAQASGEPRHSVLVEIASRALTPELPAKIRRLQAESEARLRQLLTGAGANASQPPASNQN